MLRVDWGTRGCGLRTLKVVLHNGTLHISDDVENALRKVRREANGTSERRMYCGMEIKKT